MMTGLKKVRENMKTGKMKLGKMKSAALLAAGILAAASLAGCGSNSDTDANRNQSSASGSVQQGSSQQDSSQSNAGADKQTGYLFEVNGVSLGVDMDMNELASKLGESKSIFEAPSCAAQGTAYVYDYSSFEIETYPDGEKNLIGYIILKDDTVATAEGIDLSKTRADIIKAYGDKYEESDNRLTYSKDGMKLNFIFNGEDIVSIEYASPIM